MGEKSDAFNGEGAEVIGVSSARSIIVSLRSVFLFDAVLGGAGDVGSTSSWPGPPR
jgi:hypothetical protein